MKNREHEGDQQGAQTHGEGEYGDVARSANRDRIHHSERQADGAGNDESESSPATDGKHRLSEDRQQHDEADKNAEKNRARDR
jgi:hypothetical protein